MKTITSGHFINRELSWLDFNSRVLDQAFDVNTPLMERFKFIAICSNNLDEFFMVRVAALRHQEEASAQVKDATGLNANEQLDAIRAKVKTLIKRQYACVREQLIPELNRQRVYLLGVDELDQAESANMKNYFEKDVLPVLTPVGVDPSHPFPVINNKAVEVAVMARRDRDNKVFHGFIEVPPALVRFIKVNHCVDGEPVAAFIMLEDLIIKHVKLVFTGCEILSAFPFRITKDMDFSIDEEGADDLLKTIEHKLMTTRRRQAVRLELLEGTKGEHPGWLVEQLGIDDDFVYHVPGPLDLARYFRFVGRVNRPDLQDAPLPLLRVKALEEDGSIFDAIKRHREIPLFHPFQSFDPVVRFLEEAAADPDVLAIKQTLYRVSGDSPVVRALSRAAENGKQVTVIVELKARFDEYHNIQWAKKLEQSGAHVIYGLAGLKIHCKALLVVRREDGIIKRYIHLATGNYNDSTAKIYTDIGVFFDDPELCADVAALFNVMTGYSEPPAWNKVAVAPFNLRETFVRLIEREARLSSPRSPGHIIAKMNSLVDPGIIAKLYEAAYAGVQVDLIVRGICCLKPGQDTKNINVISIVDRYLEHSRVYYFANNGSPEYYLASADWMQRNLDRRIELLFPVSDATTMEILEKMLLLQLNDTRNGRHLTAAGNYPAHVIKRGDLRSQLKTYDLLRPFNAIEKKSGKLVVLKKPGRVD